MTAIPPPKTRAKKACLNCNRRRIRCDVMERQGQPCGNCVALGVGERCEVGISRRGKYPRKKGVRREVQGGINGRGVDTSFESPAPLTWNKPMPNSSHVQHRTQRLPLPRPDPTTSNNQQQTVFLGESSPLTVVIDENRTRSPSKGFNSIQKTRLHYPIPEHVSAANTTRDELLRSHRLKMEDQLIGQEAFSFPSGNVCEILLQAYFTWFHPCFPILDRGVVHDTYRDPERSLSPLLLQAVLFIGVSLCTDTAFKHTGFESRYGAKYLFYSRARGIYDADWEANKIVKLQALFLMSFWRGGPAEERDTRFWLEAGICLAQKRGVHVMSKLSFQSPTEERLWRRIWWAYYVRDQQSSAALGLPSRIRDEDCDVARLEPDDIKEERTVHGHSVFGAQQDEHVRYPIEMAKLARILRAIVTTQYLPNQSTNATSRTQLHDQLTAWESHLPMEMRLDNQSSPSAIFLTGLLHMTYNNLYILLYRPLFLHNPHQTTSSSSNSGEGNVAVEAATRSTRIIEDMLSHNLVQHGPNHLITHIFSTLCVQTIASIRTAGTMRKLAEHRARLCLLGLQELQKSWELENWVLGLFFRCLDEGVVCSLRSGDGTTPAEVADGDGCGDRGSHKDGDGDGGFATGGHAGRWAVVGVGADRAADSMQIAQQWDANVIPAEADLVALNDWYGLFNFTDDHTDVLGTGSQPDSLNLQNLEFLYRFL